MKKLLSLAMTLAMLCCMVTTASAATVIGAGDGVDNFDDYDGTNKVDIKVTTGNIQNKYAVDMEYTDLVMSISGGNLTWDVNELEYVSDGALGLENHEENYIDIINRSDLPVFVSANIVDKDGEDGITVDYNGALSDIDANNTPFELEKATPKSGDADGIPAEMSIVYDVTSNDWDAVAEYYAPSLVGGGSVVVATVVVTISAD